MSGEIVQMTPSMNLIFETLDLSQASPATVSRCGMIYTQQSQLGWKPIVASWLKKQPKMKQLGHTSTILDLLLPKLFEFIDNHCEVSTCRKDHENPAFSKQCLKFHSEMFSDRKEKKLFSVKYCGTAYLSHMP